MIDPRFYGQDHLHLTVVKGYLRKLITILGWVLAGIHAHEELAENWMAFVVEEGSN